MKTLKAILLIYSLISVHAIANEYELVKELSGTWKFALGDNIAWASPDFNDENWDVIYAPKAWENQGYHGYDGFAWYRKHVTIPAYASKGDLYLELGYIDDVDEVYVNGQLIGSTGSFYPQFVTAYSAKRFYTIPQKILKQNAPNVIAIRVLDTELEGGIIHGELRLLKDKFPIDFDIRLSGIWNFRIGDNMSWKDLNDFNKNEWLALNVPGDWDNQGYKNYNGYAWYAIKVNAPQELVNKHLVLMLGKIDDFDQVYINGKLVGSTGFSTYEVVKNPSMYEYTANRNYVLNPGTLKEGANVITVRVFDKFDRGGMYEGAYGIITQDKFASYWKNKAQRSR